jgi:hypothetical protein
MSGFVFELVGTIMRCKCGACGMIYRVHQHRLSHPIAICASLTPHASKLTRPQVAVA